MKRLSVLVGITIASLGCIEDGGVAIQPTDVGLPALDATIALDSSAEPDSQTETPFADPFEPCDDTAQCRSGYCVPSPDGPRVCSDLCGDDDDCPEGWNCGPVANTRPDTVFICLPERRLDCLPCARDSDCNATGARCVQIGRSLRCVSSCAASECPDGYECRVEAIDDEELSLCYPESDICEACVDEDGDGFGNVGDCPDLDCDDQSPSTYPGAPELCDGADNDCDLTIDESVDTNEPAVACLDEGVCADWTAVCETGEWQCAYGAAYEEAQELSCDGLDNDCDGATDESFDTSSDPANCGGCGDVCELPRSAPLCVDGVCQVGQCEEGWHNVDGQPANGCEYGPCVPTGDETCNGEDDDCDGRIDEAFLGQPDEPDPNGIDSNCDGVDGDISRALFVAPNGDDRNVGTTPDAPLQTLARAMRLSAVLEGRDQVLVQSGLYRLNESIALVSGTSIYGGYGAGFGVRDDQRAVFSFDTPRGFVAINLVGPVRIERFEIEVTDRRAPGEAAVGLIVSNSGDLLTLDDVVVRAGQGGPGSAGADGFQGEAGTDGSQAGGNEGGAPGEIGGGFGGEGQRRAQGPAGNPGAANESACGGSGGAGSGSGGMGCFDGDPAGGGEGGGGCVGTAGENGDSGSGLGEIMNAEWQAVDGTRGAAGGRGGGGGGGGAGGGEDCVAFGVCSECGTGRGGGGGGGGGSGGGAGRGGTSGGASIGLLLVDSSIRMRRVLIAASPGGDGGAAGRGGNGGPGGLGGAGAVPRNNRQGRGGNGGRGGAGGMGGCGGPGGGGPSIGIWGVGDAAVLELENVRVEHDSGGLAGLSCSNAGNAGVSGARIGF